MATTSVQSAKKKQVRGEAGNIRSAKKGKSGSKLDAVVTPGGGLLFNKNTTTSSPTSFSPSSPSPTQEFGHATGVSISSRNMFEYMMGIKELELEYENFEERQALVTKPMQVVGNVKEISLSTAENHPVFDTIGGLAASRRTSVEYFVSYKDNPGSKDWHPVLPKDQKTVVGERLFFNGIQATLRFPAEVQTIVLYRNNLVVDLAEFVVISANTISVPLLNPQDIYTIDYKPDATRKNPWVVSLDDFKGDVQRAREVFHGTSYNKSIQLSTYPYVDYEKINGVENYDPNTNEYKPVSVKLINGSIAGPGNTRIQTVLPYSKNDKVYTYNKTLYKDKSWSEMNDYNLDPDDFYGGFDYYQWKDKVVFTETFNASQTPENHLLTHGNADVEIEYDYLATNFRLKAIFRRNTSSEVTATPELLNYSLNFKTVS